MNECCHTELQDLLLNICFLFDIGLMFATIKRLVSVCGLMVPSGVDGWWRGHAGILYKGIYLWKWASDVTKIRRGRYDAWLQTEQVYHPAQTLKFIAEIVLFHNYYH